MHILSVFIPLLSFLIAFFLSRKTSDKTLDYTTCILMTISTMLSLYCFFLIDEYNPERIIKVSEWLNSGSLYIDWSLNFNRLTALMVFLVNFVSTIVHVYSVDI